ncbi:MAG: pseudouridine synthase [Acidobacteriota bacterium]
MSHRHLLLNKPYDVICQFSDAKGGRNTLADFVPVPRVYPVGRLDRDSEGLVLLTSDGWLQHRLTDPRYDHPKTYWAQVEGIPDKAALTKLREGVQIWDDFKTRPAKIRLLQQEPDVPPRDPPIRYRALIPTAWIEIILTEGRNRQVRRMTAAVGFPTLRLVRAAIGDIHLGTLPPGESRDLTPPERDFLAPFSSQARTVKPRR